MTHTPEHLSGWDEWTLRMHLIKRHGLGYDEVPFDMPLEEQAERHAALHRTGGHAVTDHGVTREQVVEMANTVQSYAWHHVKGDWDYTRTGELGGRERILHIRYGGDWAGYNHPWRRLLRFADDFVFWRDRGGLRSALGMGRWWAWRHPVIHARVNLGTEAHVPDGVLDGGNIMVHWEETAEYLQFFQETVGSLVSDFLRDYPDHPSARLIAGEMKRISDRYHERVLAGEVDGRKREPGDDE